MSNSQKPLDPMDKVLHRVIREDRVVAKETVNHPAHYNQLPAVCSQCDHPIECIDVVRHMDFNTGNAIKYIWRAGFKGDPIEDLRKAIWYLEDEIKLLEKEKADNAG